MSVFVENSKGRINHCNRGNDIYERWFLKDGTKILFSVCSYCNKPLAQIVDMHTNQALSKLYTVPNQIEKLRKKKEKLVDYKSGDYRCYISTIATGITQ